MLPLRLFSPPQQCHQNRKPIGATLPVTVKAKPEKVTEQVNKIVTKHGEKWKKILAGMGE